MKIRFVIPTWVLTSLLIAGCGSEASSSSSTSSTSGSSSSTSSSSSGSPAPLPDPPKAPADGEGLYGRYLFTSGSDMCCTGGGIKTTTPKDIPVHVLRAPAAIRTKMDKTSPDYVTSVVTNDKGEFFVPVPPGDYSIVLEQGSLADARGPVPLATGDAGATYSTFSVASGKWTYVEAKREEVVH